MKTKVIFRKFHGQGDIIALFPEIAATNSGWPCSSYQHIGQHGSADPHGIMQNTDLATEEEYQELKKELEKFGYELEVRKKITGKMDNTRRDSVKTQ